MSKELKALKRIENFMSQNAVHWKQDIAMIETALKNYEELERKHNELLYNYEELVHCGLKSEQNKLKALEIIKEKEVNVFIFLHSGDLETYNEMVEDNRKLTQEEYDILKEVLL